MLRAEHFRALLVPLSLVIGLCLGGAPWPAAAHGDHAAAQPSPGGLINPRLVAQSKDFELVAVAQGRTLTLYLDRFTNDQPVMGAKLDVEVDGQTMSAKAEPSGVYTLTADWVAQGGNHDVIFTITSDQGSDLLAGTLEIPAAPATPSPDGASGMLLTPAVSHILAFLLGVLATVALWRRSILAAILRGAGERARRGGSNLVGAAHRGLGNLNNGLRQAGSAVGSIRGLIGRFDVATALGALRHRVDRTVEAARETVLQPRAATVGADEIRPWRRVVAAVAPVWTRPAAGRVTTPAVAVIFVVAIVAIALFLFGRGVLAHEGHDDATSGSPTVVASTTTRGAAAAAHGGEVDSGPHRLLDGSLFVPKASQRLLEVRTIVSRTSEVGRSVRMVGQVIADPGTSGEIHATMRGRLEPYNGAWPKVGQKVEVGDVLAWVVPVVNPIDRGIILQQVAQIDRQIRLLQELLPTLAAANGETSRELDDARSDLANLVRRREAIAAVVRDRDTLRAPLLAPSSGIVAASFAVAGQIVDEQQKLFTVVDLKRLWVEAYAYDMGALGKVLDANAQGPTGGNYRLKFISRGPQLQRQTIPLYFRIENPDATISVGSLVSVLVETKGERSGVILPRAAVTRSTSGQSIVWQHAHPESFVPIPVRTEAIDGKNVLISAGLAPDARVVVEAADLLNEVR
jgi:Barrel-sandwich domain of CusB or HlyD membrane-fusion